MAKQSLRELREVLRARGVDIDAVEAEVARDVEELLYSPNLKIFRHDARNHKTIHLYAELSTGKKTALCGVEINEDVPAVQITKLRGDECLKCRKRAEEVFARNKESR